MLFEHVENGFDNLFLKVFAESQKWFRSKRKKWRRVFQKKFFFLFFIIKVFVWTRRMHIWQLCGKLYAKWRKRLPKTRLRNKKRKFFRKKTAFIKFSHWRLRRQFWQLCRIVLVKTWKTFYKICEKKLDFQNLFFHQSVHLNT